MTVPCDTAGARLEDLVMSLLASLHEEDAKLIAQTVRRSARRAGCRAPTWPAMPAAA
ncbi:hypothetical protein [Streptomyces regalis]|uniref:hypothetical protein n=1 Tax=Streptomyces regalis TaxID=68262 RepID=UPI00131B3EA3|nr:hypothetical protein [Streptomyces regalis]